MTVGGKLVSYEMLLGMINRRFHECMQRHKKDKIKMNEIIRMDDQELVHTVCRKERLTLFNFLNSHLND